MENIVYSTEKDLYTEIEKSLGSIHERRCIDNKITGSNKCLGYCMYKEHSGFLTKELMQKHDCIKKKCDYFVSKPKHGSSKNKIDLSKSILNYLNNIELIPDGVRVLRVKSHTYGVYIAYYVTIANIEGFSVCEKSVYKEFGVEIIFEKLNYSFDNCVSIVYGRNG